MPWQPCIVLLYPVQKEVCGDDGGECEGMVDEEERVSDSMYLHVVEHKEECLYRETLVKLE